MTFELFVARRYLTARRKQAFISVITTISVVGIAIGVAALVIAIALITGFQGDVQDKILGATSHVMVSDLGGQGLSGYEEMAEKIRALAGVESVSPSSTAPSSSPASARARGPSSRASTSTGRSGGPIGSRGSRPGRSPSAGGPGRVSSSAGSWP
jgi:hypothetical protein